MNKTPAPKDGTRIVAVGEIKGEGYSGPFCRELYWSSEYRAWLTFLGEQHLTITSDPEATVKIWHWTPYPQ